MSELNALHRLGTILVVSMLGTGCVANQGTVATGPAPAEAAEGQGAMTSGDDLAQAGPNDDSLSVLEAAPPVDPEAVARAAAEAERLAIEVERELRASLGSDPIGITRVAEETGGHVLPLEMNDRVEAWIHYFQEVIPERFGLYLQRRGRYEPMIRQKLARAGLPQDLLFLALIESGMSPTAYSRARAVGLWQFISSTARMYDLEVSFWVDDRRDPPKATDAAIAYLSDLYEQFGSWYLAAAAYNGGPGRIRRGLSRTGVETFWDLAEGRALRSETRNYVPKLIAAAIIGRDPDRYGFGHVVLDTPIEYDLVEVPDATTFDVIAEAAGADETLVRALNPNFPRHATPPGRQVQLRLPAGTGIQFASNYAEIPPSERVRWQIHTVTRGQTLGQIAVRYGSSVTALRAANNNVNPRRLRIGQQLVVPRGRAPAPATASNQSRTAQADGPTTITVRRGDTLWAIARRYSVSTSDIMSWNNLSSSVIKPGDRLQIRR
jgi:membrane-bound lytic murein transglycosylase D